MFPLLPTRLATVCTGDAARCAALASRQDQLRGALRRVGGRVEWGVKAYAPPGNADRAPRARNAADVDTCAEAGPGGRAGVAYPQRPRAPPPSRPEARRAPRPTPRRPPPRPPPT